MKSLREDDAATFCGLHFKSKDESDSWLLRYSPGSGFGLIVDAHAVCEHMYSLMFAKDSTLSGLYDFAKIKLKTHSEGIQVMSFDRKLPKLFHKSQHFRVVKNTDSYSIKFKVLYPGTNQMTVIETLFWKSCTNLKKTTYVTFRMKYQMLPPLFTQWLIIH